MSTRLLAGMLAMALNPGVLLAAVLVVDNDGAATPSNCNAATATPYTTIQAGIDAAGTGDTVVVCPGNGAYDEQPLVNKPLILSGRGNATVKPSAMADNTTNFSTGDPVAAAILVAETASVTIESLTVDGADNGGTDCSKDPVGIFYRNASGTVRDVVVANMKLGAGLGGCQSGLGVFVQSGGGGTSNLLVQGSSVHDYQKNGITANGAGTTLVARQNRVVGLGPTPDIAQNGIQIGFGAGGTVELNAILDHRWSLCTALSCTFVSTNILVTDAADGVVIRNNGVANAQVGIYHFQTNGGSVTGNDVTRTELYDGIFVSGDNNLVQSNNVTDSDETGIGVEGNGNIIRRNRINEAPVGVWSFSGANTIPVSGANRNTFFNVRVNVHSGSLPPLAPLQTSRARAMAPSPVR